MLHAAAEMTASVCKDFAQCPLGSSNAIEAVIRSERRILGLPFLRIGISACPGPHPHVARSKAMTLRILPPLLLVACLASPALAQSAIDRGQPAALIHGNYCGLGNNAPRPPIDALDAACARHDACTPAGGLPSPACNLRFKRETAFISRDPRQPDDLRALAGFMSASAALLPFDPVAPVVGTSMPASGPYGPSSPGPYRPAYYAY